jgi:MFS family permease
VNLKRAVLLGILIGIIKVFLDALLDGWVFPLVYNWQDFHLWRNFTIFSFILIVLGNMIIGITMACIFSLIYSKIPGRGVVRGIVFGCFAYLLGSLSWHVHIYLIINLPTSVFLFWITSGFITYFLLGSILGLFTEEQFEIFLQLDKKDKVEKKSYIARFFGRDFWNKFIYQKTQNTK